jgi:hypothetical protein
MREPLNLAIVKIVQEFGRLPLSYLYSRVQAPPDEVQKQVEHLAQEGALKLEGDHVAIGKP